jgi:hypothetical protein
MKKLIIIFLCSFVLISVESRSQALGSNYRTAIGAKFFPAAFSIKHFVKKNRALEGLAYLYRDGFRVTGLYEFHFDIKGAPGLKWYVGPGAHIGFWNEKWRNRYYDREQGATVGIDGVLGLDYKFRGAPINLSVDWQPSINLTGYHYNEYGWAGIAVRYTLK